uniref:ATP binding cassette subfamily C member 5 n=1 Tax=Rousettus aegyptiacus TaxID=9407 RepID=A0A7J8HL26_ROUAE|nr:ATP binding cassette subfamily C member 5 [Rousettus aegyptiacus]
MKDIDIGKEYIIPSPGYRNARGRTTTSRQDRDHEDSKYKRTRPLECQDALETAARAEGLSLDASMHSQLRILDEEHPKGKYHHSLSALKPIRTTSKHQHPVDNAGLFSCMTFSWLSPLARLAHKKRELSMEDVWSLSKYESSDVNCRRLERLWQEELNEVGPDAASLRRVVWIFCRTRLILSIVCLMITQLAGFSGPNFQDWLYSAVRMRESSWAESLAKSSGKVMFIHWECFPQPDSYADNLKFSPSLFKFT